MTACPLESQDSRRGCAAAEPCPVSAPAAGPASFGACLASPLPPLVIKPSQMDPQRADGAGRPSSLPEAESLVQDLVAATLPQADRWAGRGARGGGRAPTWTRLGCNLLFAAPSQALPAPCPAGFAWRPPAAPCAPPRWAGSQRFGPTWPPATAQLETRWWRGCAGTEVSGSRPARQRPHGQNSAPTVIQRNMGCCNLACLPLPSLQCSSRSLDLRAACSP